MAYKIPVSLAKDSRKKAMVVSHERSGTHFLMNTLALNFGYISRPWVNLDFELGLNFHSSDSLRGFFERMGNQSILNIVKSHHQVGFVEPFLPYLLEQFHVFYIVRHPRGVMPSFRRFINRLAWEEGPRTQSVGAFMRHPPRGGMMRYQKDQVASVLERWKVHVEAWSARGRRLGEPGDGVILLRYDDLDERFDGTVAAIGRDIGLACPAPTRPRRDQNVVLPNRDAPASDEDRLTAEDEAYLREVAGDLLDRWWQPAPAEA